MMETVTKRVRGRFRFLTEVVAELKKATWLSRREVVHLTALVLATTIVVGIILWAIDQGFSMLIRLFIGG